jgi:hypothetical protein
MAVRVVVRYDKEGRVSSVEVSGDPAAVHQVLQQLLFNQASHGSAPSRAEPEPPKPVEGGEGSRQPGARRSGARASAAQRRAQPQRQEQEGLPEFARDNPWLPILARAKQS